MKFGFPLLSLILTILFIFPLPSASDVLNTKTVGKLSMALILSGIAVTVKLLIHMDHNNMKLIHAKYGNPDNFIEFRNGLDLLRVEFYGDKVFVYRNERLIKTKANKQLTIDQIGCQTR